MPAKYKTILRRAAVFPIYIYKLLISPLLPAACLYEPTCSQYFSESVMRFGVFRGLVLGLSRIIRCNGWFFKGGEDRVPEAFRWEFIKAPYRQFRK
jgi:hypothetical protein